MNYLVFLLFVLVMIDHVLKYRPEGLVFYKNSHRYSIVVALLEEPPHFDTLASYAQSTDHEWIFVNVNTAIDETLYKELNFVSKSLDPSEYKGSTEILSQVYLEGYKETSHDYLLFMNGALEFTEPKFITHMANNLVEHQLYTLKEALPKRSTKEGYKLFFDLYDDMETTADKVNIDFFSIKRVTYELCGCHLSTFESARVFKNRLLSKNINIVHIDHAEVVKRVETNYDFKPYMRHWMTFYNHKMSHGGVLRMLLMLFALHLFYLFMIIDFAYINLAMIIVVHSIFYYVVSKRAHHTFWAYVLIPIYMVIYDCALVMAQINRWRHSKNEQKETV